MSYKEEYLVKNNKIIIINKTINNYFFRTQKEI